jgi:hypothetical protein
MAWIRHLPMDEGIVAEIDNTMTRYRGFSQEGVKSGGDGGDHREHGAQPLPSFLSPVWMVMVERRFANGAVNAAPSWFRSAKSPTLPLYLMQVCVDLAAALQLGEDAKLQELHSWVQSLWLARRKEAAVVAAAAAAAGQSKLAECVYQYSNSILLELRAEMLSEEAAVEMATACRSAATEVLLGGGPAAFVPRLQSLAQDAERALATRELAQIAPVAERFLALLMILPSFTAESAFGEAVAAIESQFRHHPPFLFVARGTLRLLAPRFSPEQVRALRGRAPGLIAFDTLMLLPLSVAEMAISSFEQQCREVRCRCSEERCPRVK